MTRKNFCTKCFEKWEFIYLLFTLLKSALQKIVPTNDEEMMQNRCTRPLTIHLMSEISHLITHFQKSDFIQLIAHYQKWVHFNSPLNKCSFFWCYWTNNLNSLLACRKVSDLRFYLKVESEVVSCLPQSMVWNALLPIKCQFVSNCHVRSKT